MIETILEATPTADDSVKPVVAYHGDTEFKAAFVAEICWHKEQDRLVKGTYEEYEVVNRSDARVFRGCAIGCSAESLSKVRPGVKVEHSDHYAVAEVLGIPPQLVYLEDGIFERLPEEEAQEWPVRFAEAIPVGADLSMVWPRFAVWLLSDPEEGYAARVEDETCRRAIQGIADLYSRHIAGGPDSVTDEEWDKAARSARYASSACDARYARYARDASDASGARYARDASDASGASYASYAQKQTAKLIELLSTTPTA